MTSKLGVHIERRPPGWKEFVQQARPAIVKSMDLSIVDEWPEVIDQIGQELGAEPNIFLLGRLSLAHQPLESPKKAAQDDYAVTLFLLTERNSTCPGNDVVAQIDGIGVVLEPFDDAVNPEYEFSGEPRPQNAISEVSLTPSLSDDGQVVTLIFNNLVASLDSSTEDLVSAGIASFVMPVHSSTDQRVRLRIEGLVDRAAGTRGVLVVHHPDGTSLLHLPADPVAGFVQNLGTTVPAGQDYRVTLFLLAERNSTYPGSDVVLGIDEIEAVLE